MLLEILIRSQNEDFTEGKLVSKVKEKLKLQKIQVKEEEVFEAIGSALMRRRQYHSSCPSSCL